LGTLRSMLGLAAWLAVSFAAGGIGSRFMPGAWYAALSKPAWTPPSAVFAPVWTALYLLMGVAAWLVWRRAGFGGARAALVLFIVQLVLNALWSYLFFGLHRIDLAGYEIVSLWIVILIVAVSFWRVDWRAGVLLAPYLVWVAYAAGLNFALWRLNGGLGAT
jgi:translocator protein